MTSLCDGIKLVLKDVNSDDFANTKGELSV